jgi:hypothetical protein
MGKYPAEARRYDKNPRSAEAGARTRSASFTLCVRELGSRTPNYERFSMET